MIDEFMSNMSPAFNVQILGTLTSFIYWRIVKLNDGIRVHQKKYMEKLPAVQYLAHVKQHVYLCYTIYGYKISSSRRSTTNFLRSSIDTSLSLRMHLIPSYLYNLDISFAVSILQLQLHHPASQYLILPKRVGSYLLSTKPMLIFFSARSRLETELNVNSDWAGYHDVRLSGLRIIMIPTDSPLFWQSKGNLW